MGRGLLYDIAHIRKREKLSTTYLENRLPFPIFCIRLLSLYKNHFLQTSSGGHYGDQLIDSID